MERRKFLRVGMTGIAMISLGPLAACGNNKNRPGGDGGAGGDDGGTGGDGGGGAGADVTVNLSIEEALFEMVDGSLVYTSGLVYHGIWNSLAESFISTILEIWNLKLPSPPSPPWPTRTA
jgi:hypothetical protein